jgi:formamidopyrimidine-DNA glycosylase
MPELPEVESIKLQLERFLVGHQIEKVEIRNLRIFQGDEKELLGARVVGVRRFAKVLAIDLSNDKSILIHVKLTGQLIYRGPNLQTPGLLSKKVVGGVPGPHTHVIFHLDRNGLLFYNDVRRFGWIKIADSGKLVTEGFIGKLGPEPFKDLNLEIFENILSKTSRAVKVVLMDQVKIGGIGNIYANDALWLSRISPRRTAKSLQPDEIKKLYNSILTVLKAGLKYGGASELAYVTPDGGEGEYQKHTLVYGGDGKLCKNCKKEKIRKFFLSGRGTYFCPRCQK